MLERIGPYEVEGELGRGGMGVVYRATDPRLDRAVAIKALPEHLAADPERMARFESEAKTLAALSHPNVAGIYGVEEQDGARYLVLEFVDGDTLGDVLGRGRLPLDQLLDIAIQIAAGVAAAHDAGVIHRDLKPANVKVTTDDKVKVLDFGLAKSSERGTSDTDLANSPTMTHATQAGMILGTAGYMSPEQARGKVVDKRSDVFAFGCLLFEMLTGEQSFGGETVPDMIGAVLHREPDWSQLPAGLPARLRLLLERCLTKDRDRRLHDIADARIELEDVRAAGPEEGFVAATPASSRRNGGLIAAAFAAGVVLAGLAFWQMRQEATSAELVRRFELSGIGMPIDAYQGLVLSPDGSKLVVRARDENGVEWLKVRSFDQFELSTLPGTSSGWLPFFSTDGENLGFFALGELKTTNLKGGIPRTVAKTETGFSGGVWLEDDTIVFTGSADPVLYRVASGGGEVEALRLDGVDDSSWLASPAALPRSDAILVSVRRGSQFDIAVVTLDDRKLRIIAENGFTPIWIPTGHVIFQQGTNGPLMAVPFDATTLEATGGEFPVLDGLGARVSYQVRMFSVASDGTLAFIPAARSPLNATLVWKDAAGNETLITQLDRLADTPRLSHDGTRIAFRAPAPDCDIWVHDMVRGTTSRITREGDNHGVAWSPDDSRIATARFVNPEWRVVTIPADGSGPATTVSESNVPDGFVGTYTPDGEYVFVGSRVGGLTANLNLVSLADGTVTPTLQSRFDENGAVVAPNGKYIAYTSNESGRDEIYVQAYPDLDTRIQISTNGGNEPLWSRDGTQLYYRWGVRLMVADVTTSPTFAVGRPTLAVDGGFARGRFGTPGYDVGPDGRFVVFRERYGDGVVEIKVILNWFEELEALAPAR